MSLANCDRKWQLQSRQHFSHWVGLMPPLKSRQQFLLLCKMAAVHLFLVFFFFLIIFNNFQSNFTFRIYIIYRYILCNFHLIDLFWYYYVFIQTNNTVNSYINFAVRLYIFFYLYFYGKRKCDFSTACIILFITFFFTRSSLYCIVFFYGFFLLHSFIMYTLNVLIKPRLFGHLLCMHVRCLLSVVFYNYFIRVAYNRHIVAACLFAFNCDCLESNRTRCTLTHTHTYVHYRI